MDSFAGLGANEQPEPTESEIDLETAEKARAKQKLWLSRLSTESHAHKKWRDRAADVYEIYHQDSDELYVPLYWSVVNVEHVGVYSNQPVPDVRPRHSTEIPVFRSTAELIERGLAYCADQKSFDDNMHRAVDDFLSVGLGMIRVKIDSVIETTETVVPFMEQDPLTGMFMEGERTETSEEVKDQYIRWEYVPYDRFGWEPCNNWKHCEWIYFRHRMTRKQIRARFGKEVAASKDESEKASDWKQRTYDIYEIWCKEKKEVIFLAKGETEPLEVIPDPLELKGFYPIPEPMLANVCASELVPKPDYDYIESYDAELNRLQQRRMGLLEQIKATGAYDKGLPELAEMLENDDGEFTPVQNLMQRLSQTGGVENALHYLPIQEKVQALQVLTEQIGFVKAQVDEILGISDIVRGVTAASETATAQEIKGRWVGVRLTRKREIVQYTVREMMRVMAQLLATHITPENLQRMTAMQITEEMMMVLQSDMLMEFSIDIEIESTVAKDEFKEREVRAEMMNAVGQFSQSVLPMVQQNVMPADTASAILRTALAPYARYDRALDESLNTLPTTAKQMQEQGQQLQQAQQENQQLQQQVQQWQQIAQQLQMQATEAKAERERADANKKTAETRRIYEEMNQQQPRLEGDKTEAETNKIRAETVEKLRNPVQNGPNSRRNGVNW